MCGVPCVSCPLLTISLPSYAVFPWSGGFGKYGREIGWEGHRRVVSCCLLYLRRRCDVALQPNGRAPYTTAAAATAVLDAWRDHGFTTPITAEILLTRTGIPESISKRTLQSLRELELVDGPGQPTPVFEAFRHTRGDEEYRAALQHWLRDVYADILQHGDPSTDEPHRIREAFRTYEPVGQRLAMTSLLVGLWRYAGLPVAASKASSRPTKTAPKTRTPRKRAHKGTDSSIGPVGAKETSPSAPGLLFGLTESDGAAMSDAEFYEVWAALGKVALVRSRKHEAAVDQKDSQVSAEAEDES